MGNEATCEMYVNAGYCTNHQKHLHRCCPESCQTWRLTAANCEQLSGLGYCVYPNEGQPCGNLAVLI